MGNFNSKLKDDKHLTCTRSETSNSLKSTKSLKSKISLLKDELNRNLSFSSSSTLLSPKSNIKTPKFQVKKNLTPMSSNEKSDYFSCINMSNISNINLPPSMIHAEPKEPILIKGNVDSLFFNNQKELLESSVSVKSTKSQSSILKKHQSNDENNLKSTSLNLTSVFLSPNKEKNVSVIDTSIENSDKLITKNHSLQFDKEKNKSFIKEKHILNDSTSCTPTNTTFVSSNIKSKSNSTNSDKTSINQNEINNTNENIELLNQYNEKNDKITNSFIQEKNENQKDDLNSKNDILKSLTVTPNKDPKIQFENLNLKSNPMSNNVKVVEIENLIQRLLDAGYRGKRMKKFCLKNSEIHLICSNAREIFLSQPSLLDLLPPVKVVGDIHGQYSDLIRIFTKCGYPPTSNYLFLGDYVDRGKQSLETILLLLCYKIKYPENFFLLRGNHECGNITRVYGFYDECKRRCNIKIWKSFIDTFDTLPIAAIVAGKIFCVHGGLSPSLNSMDEIKNILRPTDVPDFGLLNDLLWSDPADTTNEWEDNERGVSYVFSKVAINKFLSKFNFDLVCRAHMVVEDGYEFFNDRSLVTVFLAPNYCGEFDNWGAAMSVTDDLLCSFDLIEPLDSLALKRVMKKGKRERKSAQLQQKLQ